MTASELIEVLARIIKANGDLDVYTTNRYNGNLVELEKTDIDVIDCTPENIILID